MKKHQETNQAEPETQTEHSTETTTEARPMPTTEEVDAIIRKRVYASIGVGMVPIPLVDLAGLTAIQIELTHALATAYGVEFSKERVKSILASLGGSVLTVASAPMFASLFKSIPLIGSTAGAATVCITGGAATYAIGSVFAKHFREGGDLFTFDAQGAKTYFKDKLEEGKAVAAKLKPKKKGETSEEAAAEPGATA